MIRYLKFGIYQVNPVDQRAFVFSINLLSKSIATFCDCTDQFVYDLAGTPSRQASHDAAQINTDLFQFGY